jgi:hypothetical protein
MTAQGTTASVKAALTPKPRTNRGRARRTRVVENGAYTAFCGRAIRSAGRRIADGDIDALADLVHLATDVDTALITAVTGLREFGYSWAQIADRLGVTRQAAQQRWGGDRP